MSHYSAILIQPTKKTEPTQRSIRDRLQELLKLEDGWLNGEGKSLPESGIEQFANSFEEHFNTALPMPYLFPTPEGNLQAEWAMNDVDISLHIYLSNQSAFYQASFGKSQETDEMVLNLAEQLGWQKLIQKLTALSKS